MNKMIKLISMLLTVFMLLSSLSTLFTIEVFAAEAETEKETESGAEGSTEKSEGPAVEIKEEIDYTTEVFATPEEKLASMRLALEKDGYQLYVDDYSGEVACVNTVTGEKLFTNPYDVGASTGNETTKYEVLSQIIVKFTDQQGQDKTFTSYEEAVLRGQVVTEPIKNGLRVEYTIGREQTKTLVPRLISKERFDDIIMAAAIEAFGEEGLYSDEPSLEAFKFQKFLTYYVLYSKEELDVTKEEKDKMNSVFGGVYDGLINSDRSLAAVLKDYPIVDNMPVYVFDPNASESEIAMCEELILTYCPEYTYEELEYDHSLTEYESEDENPPVFRMALEYKLDGEGLSVRLPANGIRFNESLYTMESIEVLPYMGAGNSGYAGYNFFPDGSGTLFDYEDLNTKQTRSVLGKVYGTDFAYHEITGTYQKVIRYPVFGMVEESSFYTYTVTDIDTGEVTSENKIAGAMVEAIRAFNAGEDTRVYTGKAGTLSSKYSSVINNPDATETYSVEKRGFVAIIEEGDALASLATYHAGSLSDYNTIKMSFTPRPKDSYNLRDSISVGSNSEWTVVSERKYVGGYKMRYLMLSDPEAAAEKGAKTYDASWLGMAIAYRDYLTEKGIISKISEDKLTEDIPLYIETFGAAETTEKILSVPVTVMAPLTSFEDVLQMYTDLSAQGIKNINFKLTGYANGGMYSAVPGRLKFEKEVGGNDGFQALLDEAAKINAADKNNNLGIFPDFNIVFDVYDELFNGYNKDDHAAKTIDDRYANRREYSATQQKYENFYEIVISPAYFYVLYERITKNYAEKYDNVKGISVSTLGSWLNSDFDEDEPYNREDSKAFTIKAFEYLDNTYDEVMTDGGNSYVWKYVDHMLDVSLDSSRYNFSANAVPFIGVVLHGSVSFTGEPLNMEGDLQYAILKAIENGASPYFILSMRNTQILKEYFDLSKYYSIRYDIWNKDIADVYNTLNDTLKDVQDKYITNHEFLTGERVPDSDELEADIYNEYLADLEAEQNAAEIVAKEIALAASVARKQGRDAEAYAAEAVLEAFALYTSQLSSAYTAITFDVDYYNEVLKAYKLEMPTRDYSSFKNSEDADKLALYEQSVRAKNILSVVADYDKAFDEIVKLYDANMKRIEEFENNLETLRVADLKKQITAKLLTVLDEADAKNSASGIVDKILAKEATSITDDDYKNIVKEQILVSAVNEALRDIFVDELVETIVDTINTNKEKAEAETEKTPEEVLAEALVKVIKSKLNKIADSKKSEELANKLSKEIATEHAQDDATALEAVVVEILFSEDAVKDEADSKLYEALVSELVSKTIKIYVKSSSGKDKLTDLYKVYNNAVTNYNSKKASEKATEKDIADALEAVNQAKAAVDAIDADLIEYAEAYMAFSAASSAHKLVISSGFNLSFDECYDAYFEYEKANMYSVFAKLSKAEDANEEFVAYYTKYVDTKVVKDTIEALAKTFKQTKGSVDNYVDARAQMAAAIELGYDKSEDPARLKRYTDAKKQVADKRKNAINAVARIDGLTLRSLEKTLETLMEHLELATEAIETLAIAEGVTVQYKEGSEHTVRDITNYDELAEKSLVVKQAIDRATATADYLEKPSYQIIEDGKATEYSVNGKTLYYTRNEQGEKLYFYGRYEEGYSYFTPVVAEDGTVTYDIYHRGSKTGKILENGLEIYEFSDYAGKGYYTASLEEGYTYYEYDANYDVYTKKVATTYDGEEFATLDDGTVIYLDGNVYYSVNEDGTYTRYNYYLSANEYYELALATRDEVKALATKMATLSGDNNFSEDVQKRIDYSATSTKEEEEEEEEEVVSRYFTENIVAVTYGNEDGTPFKTIILNYNNFAVRVVYADIEYTIPAYEFVVIQQ